MEKRPQPEPPDNPGIEKDYEPTVTGDTRSRILPGTALEILREVPPAARFSHVLFDFDGTLSLIRQGWPEVMVPMMVEELQSTGTGGTAEELHRHCLEFVMRLNGKQTIYQMMQLAKEVRARGGVPREPAVYKEIYHSRLMERISSRREALRSGAARPEDYLVPGALRMLQLLRELGVQLYLASGTDEQYVVEEAALLRLVPFFGEHIHGARDDFRAFSKKLVIERILRENGIEGEALLAFGDGYVEIENVRAAGGFAIAVASDEAGRSGKADPWKRERLIGVGADMVVPDFQHADALLRYLFGGLTPCPSSSSTGLS
jgi:phosphoglycolate phosphatase-like HAD superfamily hydrolase